MKGGLIHGGLACAARVALKNQGPGNRAPARHSLSGEIRFRVNVEMAQRLSWKSCWKCFVVVVQKKEVSGNRDNFFRGKINRWNGMLLRLILYDYRNSDNFIFDIENNLKVN